jgi:hypothetical protein
MFKSPTFGAVEICGVDRTGNIVWKETARNTLTHAGVDLIARMLAWEPVRINAAYLEFIPSGGSFTSPTVDPAESTYYASLTAASGSDILRVPIYTPPYTTSTNEAFAGNKVVFSAFSDDGSGINGKEFGTGASVVGLALVHAPVFADADGSPVTGSDVVFARTYSFTSKVKEEHHQIMLRWAHTVGDIAD